MKKRIIALMLALAVCLGVSAMAEDYWKQSFTNFLNQQAQDAEYYMIADIDADALPELLVMSGTCEADMLLTVYAPGIDQVIYMGELGGGHSLFGALQDGGLIRLFGQMGDEELYEIYVDDNDRVAETCVYSNEQVEDYLPIDTLPEYDVTDMSGVMSWDGNPYNANQAILDSVR